MTWQAGAAIRLKTPMTTTAQNCGLNLEMTGHVTFVQQNDVSFYINRPHGGMEAHCSADVFAMNFAPQMAMGINRGYIRSKPFPKKFPEDFLRR